MKHQNPELLSPAGNMEALKAAVQNGANAVYLGASRFSARKGAGNFDPEELEEAIGYAHARGVRVYLAVNTLLRDSELGTAMEIIAHGYAHGVDAVIIQDMGLAASVHHVFPDLPMHASTQTSVNTADGVQRMAQAGFSRVVLARELNLEEIRLIADKSTIELEVFVHGALCIGYSGQCLFSSFIGGRSGNRGDCAQTCRMGYQLTDGDGETVMEGYLLSPKDNGQVDQLGALLGAGALSLKIEGRLKQPEYVAEVTRIYRKALDMAVAGSCKVDEDDRKRLTQAFNRGGFTEGYLHGRAGIDRMSWQKPKNWGIRLGTITKVRGDGHTVTLTLEENLAHGDGIEVWTETRSQPSTIASYIKNAQGMMVSEAMAGETVETGLFSVQGASIGDTLWRTSCASQNQQARRSLELNTRKIPAALTFECYEGTPCVIRATAGQSMAEITGPLPQQAQKAGLTQEKVLTQLQKCGDTPFEPEIRIVLDEGLFLPASELNRMRREVMEALEAKVIAASERTLLKAVELPGLPSIPIEKPLLSALFWTANSLPENPHGLDRIIIPLETAWHVRERIRGYSGMNVFIEILLPAMVQPSAESKMWEMLNALKGDGISGVILANHGQLIHAEALHREGLEVRGDNSLNAFNTYGAAEILSHGLSGVMLAPEVTYDEAMSVGALVPAETAVYGRMSSMVSIFCPVGAYVGGENASTRCHGACSRKGWALRDSKGARFPVLPQPELGCGMRMLHALPLQTADRYNRLSEIRHLSWRLYFYDETPEEVTRLTAIYRYIFQHGDLLPQDEAWLEARRRGPLYRGWTLKVEE